MKMERKSYGNSKEILKFVDHYVAMTNPVLADGAIEEDGKKVVKAGSILDVNGAVVNDGTAVGVLLHDVDVTYGNANGTVVIHGYIDGTKLPKAEIAQAVIDALPQIKFFDVTVA